MTNQELLRLAYDLATYSPDPSTQIGSFLISFNGQIETLTQCFNKPSFGVRMTDVEWENRNIKYALVEHSERGTLYKAARYGIQTSGATMVASWAACADCARGIVASGICKIIRHMPPIDAASHRWFESVKIGDSILHAGDVEVVDVYGPISKAPLVLRGGSWFNPAIEEDMAYD